MTDPKTVTVQERWKGYATQSQPWRRGYNWARREGAHAHLPCTEAMEAWGYDIESEEAAEFGRGADFATLLESQLNGGRNVG